MGTNAKAARTGCVTIAKQLDWVAVFHHYLGSGFRTYSDYYYRAFPEQVRAVTGQTEKIPALPVLRHEFDTLVFLGEVRYRVLSRGKASLDFWAGVIEESAKQGDGGRRYYEEHKEALGLTWERFVSKKKNWRAIIARAAPQVVPKVEWSLEKTDEEVTVEVCRLPEAAFKPPRLEITGRSPRQKKIDEKVKLTVRLKGAEISFSHDKPEEMVAKILKRMQSEGVL